ncbi:nodulation protein NfeD [Sphingosinicella sp. CPCC 101087]|uniref:NfeD family protein n=1 Tax=Sphingosinicella sp. CPCC 101087 TaxID=2497754 RepID=UPI001FB0BB3D|nr:nodulation protein NfeD [Sphingosinicella sp. CPCC 101087]
MTNRRRGWLFVLLALAGALLSLEPPPASGQTARSALLLTVDGAIGPATADYFTRSLARAEAEGAAMVVIRMDTPGGLDSSMRDIIREILRSPVPVVTFVHPSGARAASAGTFILYASHVAAMSPGTNLGAATPVPLGAPSPAPSGPDKQDDGNRQGPVPASASDAKAVNDAAAYIRSLAELRGRNADWGEQAVRGAASLSAAAALERNVVDLIAPDLNALMAALNGRTVKVSGGDRTLQTRGISLVPVEPNWRTRLLAAITNPNVALILMMLGVYGLFFELMNPGALIPGTIGAICLLVGLYALAALPVNIAGIALILLGVGLMAGEAFAPSFGILGIGGLVAFILGGTILIDTDVPEFRLSWPTIAAIAVASLAMLIATARVALTGRRRRIVSGAEELVGAQGKVLDWKKGRGHVFVHSERWRAVGPERLEKDENVRVTRLDGLVLAVQPVADSETG